MAGPRIAQPSGRRSSCADDLVGVRSEPLATPQSPRIRTSSSIPGAIAPILCDSVLGASCDPPHRDLGLAHSYPPSLDRERWRLGCWALHVIAAGSPVAGRISGSWPLPTGLGGVVGARWWRAPALCSGPPNTVYRCSRVHPLCSMIATLLAGGFGSRPKKKILTPIADDERGAVSSRKKDRAARCRGLAGSRHRAQRRGCVVVTLSLALAGVNARRRRSRSFEAARSPNLGPVRAAPSLAAAG